ncbi:MAG: hypothetical protein HY366_00010 [Candidatus Aenigmarchaeota archaeon]|nr:hypothetical protein [Candidatus Aenigmarchaeota archaeon]
MLFGRDTPLLFEDVPPTDDNYDELLPRRIERLRTLAAEAHLDAVNVPDVHVNEATVDGYCTALRVTQPRRYASDIHRATGIRTVLNVVVPYYSTDELEKELLGASRGGIHDVVLVGGAGKGKYVGPRIPDANAFARRLDYRPHVTPNIGNIAVPTRRDAVPDEPQRILQKVRTGASYLTSQIVYEAESTVRLLAELDRLFAREHEKPPLYFIGVAPVTSERDVKFLQWLGVKIPPQTENEILSSDEPSTASMAHALGICDTIQTEVRERGIRVPLGVLVEYASYHSFDAAAELAQQLDIKRRERVLLA